MASSAEYLEYVLDLLGDVPDVTTRKMMGEYLLYASGKLFGGVYDDRFLVKDTEASRAVLSVRELPYEGAQPMLVVDVEDRETVAAMVEEMLKELPEPKRRRRSQGDKWDSPLGTQGTVPLVTKKQVDFSVYLLFLKWWAMLDSNQRPHPCEGCALPLSQSP